MKTFRFFMSVCVVILILSQCSWATDSLFVRRIGTVNTRESAYACALAGSYAYVANDDSGIRVIDISNVSAPVIVGRYNTPGWAQGLFLQDTLLYVADRNQGFRILSVANPTTPVNVGSIIPTGTVRGVFVVDTIAYLACDNSGLAIYSIRNPAAPTLLATLATTQSYAVKVVDTVAYVANLATGFSAISVANPRAPRLLSTLAPVGTERIIDVIINSSKAFLANANGRIQRIVNIANPSAMAYVDSIILDSARAIVKQDTMLFYACSDSGLEIASYVSGNHPIRQGYNHKMGTTIYWARGVSVRDTFAFLSADLNGLVVYNFAQIYNQQHINVLTPTVRDSFRTRQYATVRWTTQNVYDSVKIQFSRSSPVSWRTVGYDWAIDTAFTFRVYNPANLSSTPSIVRVVSMDDSSIIGTSPVFTVLPPAANNFIATTSPVAGENWQLGTRHVVRWIHSDSVLVIVSVVRNGQSSRLGTTTADSFPWIVSGNLDTAAYFKVAQYPDSFYLALSPFIRISANGANDAVVPREFKLHDAYPNPFNATTTIRYSVPYASNLKVDVFDINGSSVYQSEQRIPAAGEYSLALNGNKWSSGVYFVRIQAGVHSGMMKVVLLK